MYVIGGHEYTATASLGLSERLLRRVDGSLSWAALPSMAVAREYSAVATDGVDIYVFGGYLLSSAEVIFLRIYICLFDRNLGTMG